MAKQKSRNRWVEHIPPEKIEEFLTTVPRAVLPGIDRIFVSKDMVEKFSNIVFKNKRLSMCLDNTESCKVGNIEGVPLYTDKFVICPYNTSGISGVFLGVDDK